MLTREIQFAYGLSKKSVQGQDYRNQALRSILCHLLAIGAKIGREGFWLG